jgi:putative hydrolases of HD superfamily
MTKDVQKITHFLYELGTLRKTARSHRQALLTDDLSDSISSHSYRVTVIGWFLAKLEKVDPYKVVMMCLLHDTSETRTGDQNWIHKKYTKTFEEEAIHDQLNSLIFADDLLKITDEYSQRISKEAKIAKDADLLDQVFLLKEYAWQGNQEALLWLKDNEQIKLLASQSAKFLAQEILSQNPSDWWSHSGWSAERRK